MAALATDQRNRLETTVKAAREAAEAGARQALEALAVDRSRPFDSMTDEQKELRRRLRLHGRQIGDTLDRDSGVQTIHRLVREVAYEHWHRMLFARFLAENDLLIEPETGVAVSLEECADLARERGEDPWPLAASFAERMLPRIFRADDPALAVTLPPETRQALQDLLGKLPSVVFTEDDSLGWTYQFWQSAEKDAVNARAKSGEKITGEMLPAVTQLFTEPYMVKFLLDNTIGAWHAGRTFSQEARDSATSERELREAVRIREGGGYDFDFLRFVREGQDEEEGDDDSSDGPWRPAAGSFERWPEFARELTILDPCCGSGHFLVAVFDLLTRLRMQEEGLTREDAARAVISENLFGLELDPRCTQIAAFSLALAAWKFVGRHIELPPVQIACSGLAPNASKDEWLAIAEDGAQVGGMPGKRDLFGSDDTLLTAALRGGLDALYDLFERAPNLGSLIDPQSIGGRDQAEAFQADVTDMESVLDRILAREEASQEQRERAVAARGMATAARILMGPREGYTLVITNVPYLARGSHAEPFKRWVEANHGDAKQDLATVFVSRMLRWVDRTERAGTVAAVTPQNWLFLTSYRKLRERLLKEQRWEMVARLGPGAFETISGEVVNVALLTLSGHRAPPGALMSGVDAAHAATPTEKATLLRGDPLDAGSGEGGPSESDRDLAGAPVEESEDDAGPTDGRVRVIPQAAQLENPDARVTLVQIEVASFLSAYCTPFVGLGTGDSPKYMRWIWELPTRTGDWALFQGPVGVTQLWGGAAQLVAWDPAVDRVRGLTPAARERIHNQDQSGQQAWGKPGIAVSLMGELRASVFAGSKFDKSIAVLVTDGAPRLREAVWCFCASPEFNETVRRVDQNLMCSAGATVKVPFDLERWQKAAEEKYPDGLPEPYSDDPTQWLFHGHPAHADQGTGLHVGLARLLGYRWPAESDPEMRLSDEARALIAKSKELDGEGFTDDDGIVCLSPVRGESSAAERLRELMAAAYGSAWTTSSERELLGSTAAAEHGKGKPARSLDDWLRKHFFEEHCRLFQNRPFIWHIWDGLKDGFNALVNYHRLAAPDGRGRRTLESLTYSYLGEWIDRQRQAQKGGVEGADARLAAAQRLQGELEKILGGEPPYDIFVRWKPLHELPLGWDPDLNDGVQLNIRPFMKAEDVGRKGAGILRYKPNCRWTPDRGKEPESLRPREDFPWFWSCNPKNNPDHRVDFGADTADAAPAGEAFDGKRWNELHYTGAAKQAARSAHQAEVDA